MGRRAIRKILLLRSPSYETTFFPPLALGVLSAFLRSHGFEVDQHDLNGRWKLSRLAPSHPLAPLRKTLEDSGRLREHLLGGRDSFLERSIEDILEGVDVSDADLVLLSPEPGFYEPAKLAILIGRAIKGRMDVPVIVGGEYQQFKPIDNMFEFVHSRGFIDYEVHGPGENLLLELIGMLEGRTDPGEVPGLVWMDGSSIRRNPFSLSTKPIHPDFNGLRLDDYIWRPDAFMRSLLPDRTGQGEREVLMLPVQFIIGCPNRCAFCNASAGIRLNAMKPREAARMLAGLSEEYGTGDFYFLHPTLNISRKFIHALCDEIIRLGLDLRWTDCARINYLDRETVAKMRRAGAVRLVIGMETASPRLLSIIGKEVKVEEVEETFRVCHEEGIFTSIEIITGLPQERDGDVQATVDFLERNNAHIDEIWINRYFLENNSLMFRHPDRYGLENIRHVRKGDFDGDEMFCTPGFAYAFDEVGGLRWKEKREQIELAYKNVVEAAGEKMGKAHDRFKERPALLLYLSRVASDPEKLRELFFLRDRHLSRRASSLSLDHIVAKLKEIHSPRDLKRLVSKALKRKL